MVLVTGPRQSGKTTFLRHEAGKRVDYISFDDPLERDFAVVDPAGFLGRFTDRPVILDEIQYVPGLLSHLKMRIDKEPGRCGRWLLTGSQQFGLMRDVSESLAGRVAILELPPFSQSEFPRPHPEDVLFNILAILGLSALIIPVSVHTQVIRQELPVMIGAGVLLLVLGQDGQIGVIDASLLSLCLIVYTVFLVVQSRREEKAAKQSDPPSEEGSVSPPALWLSVGLVLVGLALLVFGSGWLVEASIAFAKALGVSDLDIGLTMVAAGTSMPELAASIAAALKGERDMAVGNVIGSCTFNIFGCLDGICSAPHGDHAGGDHA